MDQFAKQLGHNAARRAVARNIGESELRNNAVRTDRNVMNVAAELSRCDRIGINPASQTGKLDGVIHAPISAPHFQARQLDDVFELLGAVLGDCLVMTFFVLCAKSDSPK